MRACTLALVLVCVACREPSPPDSGTPVDAGAYDAGARNVQCVETGHHSWTCVSADADAGDVVVRAFELERQRREAQCAPLDRRATFCVADGGVMRAGAPLRVELIQLCGSKCDPGPLHCGVTLGEHVIELSLVAQTCNGRTGCPPGCVRRRLTCEVPALDGGEWTVKVAGDAGPDALLRLAPDGEVRCALP